MRHNIQIGDKTPEFSLIGSDGMIHTLVDYKGYKGVCFFFFSLTCNVSKKAFKEIENLKLNFKKKSIAFVGICNKDIEDSFSNALKKLNDLNLDTDLLLDATGDITNKFGVTSTPHFFIFNQSRHLIYNGCCKKNLFQETNLDNPNYITQTLNELVGGIPISIPKTDLKQTLESKTVSC